MRSISRALTSSRHTGFDFADGGIHRAGCPGHALNAGGGVVNKVFGGFPGLHAGLMGGVGHIWLMPVAISSMALAVDLEAWLLLMRAVGNGLCPARQRRPV